MNAPNTPDMILLVKYTTTKLIEKHNAEWLGHDKIGRIPVELLNTPTIFVYSYGNGRFFW